jgi:hypothetical protein
MRCAICDHTIHPAMEPVVSTKTGDWVHITCADNEARAAYHQRTCRATVTTSIGVGLLGLFTLAGIDGVTLIVITIALIIGHLVFNQRWWRLTLSLLRRRRR